MLLFIKTDEKSVYIAIDVGGVKTERSWEAGRELSRTILQVIQELESSSAHTLSGIVVYEGPGSYTGLRIGISVANAIGYARDIPVVATSGSDWAEVGAEKLKQIEGFTPISPVYGRDVYTTKPRK